MRDRIRPPADLEKVLDLLKEKGVFETKQKGLMFAASLGYALNSTRPGGLDMGKTGEGIRLQYFQKPRDEGFIDALAVASTGKLEVLTAERGNERLDIFERYAHSGLEELQRRLDTGKGDELEIVCGIIAELGGLGSGQETDDKVKRLGGLV